MCRTSAFYVFRCDSEEDTSCRGTLMRFKLIAYMLAVALLSVVAHGGEDDNQKKGRNPAR
jgi:hypothetical protein